MEETMEDIIRKLALKNAVAHRGVADKKAVISKLLGENPDLRKRAKEIIPEVMQVISVVNSMDTEAQRAEVIAIDPGFFSVEKKEKKGLPPLPGAEDGKVVTRMPPEPNGYPHIGNGLSFFFNYYYAKRYNGKVILRFDDTNPRAEKLEYYDAIKQDMKWLGLSWDKEHNMSDDMDIYYTYARHLIDAGSAYMCSCEQEIVSKLRFKGQSCSCRDRSKEENLVLWDDLFSADEGRMVLRIKGDNASQNTAMRDPTLFRVIRQEHPLQGDKYTVWPVYDFACAIEDSILGITHVLRSNEFALRIELQDYIRSLLGLRCPITKQYSRFSIRGSPTSKRLIRPLIENNLATGWDDPRLVTIRGLRRRGIIPETVNELAKEIGLSTAEPEIDWSLLESLNRKLIDPVAKRFFFVEDPVRVDIKGIGPKTLTINMHPTKDLGKRTLEVGTSIYISTKDARSLDLGSVIRLKDFCNIRIEHADKTIEASLFEEEVDLRKLKKIQWVPLDGINVQVMVLSPLYVGKELQKDSIRFSNGLGEKDIASLPVGEIVQFERYGFVRIDSKEDGIKVVFAHS